MHCVTLFVGDENGLRSVGPGRPKGSAYPTDKALGEDLRAFRLAHGMTQLEVANLVGLPYPTISRIETGKHSITKYIRNKIDVAFQVMENLE